MWTKKVKAGILLYALLMASVFSLLLECYLQSQVAEQRIYVSRKNRVIGYAKKRLEEKEESSDQTKKDPSLQNGHVKEKKNQ